MYKYFSFAYILAIVLISCKNPSKNEGAHDAFTGSFGAAQTLTEYTFDTIEEGSGEFIGNFYGAITVPSNPIENNNKSASYYGISLYSAIIDYNDLSGIILGYNMSQGSTIYPGWSCTTFSSDGGTIQYSNTTITGIKSGDIITAQIIGHNNEYNAIATWISKHGLKKTSSKTAKTSGSLYKAMTFLSVDEKIECNQFSDGTVVFFDLKTFNTDKKQLSPTWKNTVASSQCNNFSFVTSPESLIYRRKNN